MEWNQSFFTVCVAAVTFYVGAFHFLFFVQFPKRRENLAFALACAAIAIYDVFSAGLYSAGSCAEGAVWQKRQVLALCFVGATMVWFTSEFVAGRVRKADFPFFVFWALMVPVLIFDRTYLTFTDYPLEKHCTLFGISFHYYEVRPGLLVDIQSFVGVLAAWHILRSLLSCLRQRCRPEARPIIVGMIFVAAAVVNDTLVSSGVYSFVYLIETSYLWMVICMAYALTREHLVTQKALSVSEEKYRHLVDSLPDAIFITDERGIVLSVSGAAGAVFGAAPSEMAGRPFESFFHADSMERVKKFIQDVVARSSAAGDVIVVRGLPREGRQIWLSLSATVSTPLGGGRIEVHGIARDVTQRAIAEEERARLAAAVEAADESIIITDTNGVILYVNPCFERMTGYARKDIIGKTPAILQSGRHDRSFYSNMWATISSGQTWHGFFVNRRKDGVLFEEEAVISPVRDSTGRIVNYVAVKRDVTQQRLLEAELRHSQTMEAVGRLARGVAHDLTNMLVIITNSLHLLQQKLGAQDETVSRHLSNIVSAAEKAGNLTAELMAFSQKAPMSLREIDLNKSARSLEEMLVRTLGPSIQLLVVTNPEPLITRIDPTHVEQAIVHLAINASDAMPSGGFLTIQTEYIHIDDIAAVQMQRGLARGQRISGDVAVLRVSDSGAGMTAEVQARIFEPFFTTKGKGRSTGLGLSTVLGIVQSMGGAMTVHSVPGVGTSFAMYFPLVKPRKETSSDTAPTRPAKILVLNEDAMELNVASRLLSKLGHKPVAAESSKDALRIIQDANVELDCMVCSLHLSGTDARDFVSNVRKIRQAISVIYLSGFPAEHLVRCGRITASDVVVSRPYTLNSLRAALNAAAGKQTGSIAS